MDETSLSQASQHITSAHSVLVVCHIRPDGDALGALLGLGLALTAAGKQVQMACADRVPGNYRFLSGSDQIVQHVQGDFDCIITVDCSDLKRTGSILENLRQPDINIDHHITNLNFAHINLVDGQAVSTTQILARLLPAFDLPVNHPVAEALLTGLVTDTIGFRTANTTPAAMRLAADLMDLGADLPDLYFRGLVGRSTAAVRLWGLGLSRLQNEDRLVWTYLTLADRRAVKYSGKDDADLMNVLSAIEDTDVSFVMVEQSRTKVKVSWRARPGFDVSQVAMQFGGGGHAAAAGAEIQLPIEAALPEVLQATRQVLSQEQIHASADALAVPL